MGKEDKQFPLNTKQNCCIYLNRIISSCELCMDSLKDYNDEMESLVLKYRGQDTIPYNVYKSCMDKSYNVIRYIDNLLGDCQTSSISYFKYRTYMKKQVKKGIEGLALMELTNEIEELLSEFNKKRNWQNHIPESILVAEVEMLVNGQMELPMDPVEITHYNYVTFEYFEDLYLSNVNCYKLARKVIQAAKKEYSMLMGKRIMYPRIYTDKPLGLESMNAAKKSALVQGLKVQSDKDNI